MMSGESYSAPREPFVVNGWRLQSTIGHGSFARGAIRARVLSRVTHTTAPAPRLPQGGLAARARPRRTCRHFGAADSGLKRVKDA